MAKTPTGRKFDRLKRSARQSALYRGHDLANFDTYLYSRGISGCAKCRVCGAEVQVITNPLPNEIEIGGEAVAIGCKE